jgi:VWFA-related protein
MPLDLRNAACTLLLCSGLFPALAQDERPFVAREPVDRPKAAEGAGAPRIRVDSDLVLVPVVVTDPLDRLVTGLEKDRFRVLEDGVEQQVTHFSTEDAPVSVVIVFDTSGSMGPKLQKSRMAVAQFLEVSNPEDEFALVQFSDRARLLEHFTADHDEIGNRLAFIQSRGRTALLDAIALSLNEMKNARHSRKAILIISDGGDNCSRFSDREIRRRVREADVQIYAVGVMEPRFRRGRTPEEAFGPSLLEDLASASGGRLYEADYLDDLADIAVKIGSALRNVYVLGYAPSTPKRDGKYHRITVKVSPPEGFAKIRASFRSSYLAPAE